MSGIVVIALIISGLLVGFINTLAGGGTIISISLFMFLGLPAGVANGTNRIAIILQTLTSSANFKRQKVLDSRKGLILGIPTVIGSLIGAEIAVDINENIFKKAIAIIMLVMMVFIVYKPQQWLNGQQHLVEKKTSFLQYIIFFLIGLYGGFIHVGVGYFILAGLVLGSGYDLVKANALKVFIVLLYAPFTLLVFVYNKQINYEYGLIHAVGNIIGAYIASRFAVSWGANFVRWIIIIIILITSTQLLGMFDFKTLFKTFL
ncbi:MAG: sulfite exporter TauE/SafE family protein [Bacteroidales bacterium]